MKFLKKLSIFVSLVILACNATGYTSYAIEDPVLESYAEELGSKTDRFSFRNSSWGTINGTGTIESTNSYYQDYFKHCSTLS